MEKKVNYKDVLAQNAELRKVAKSYEACRASLVSNIELLTKGENYPITKGMAKKYLPKTTIEARDMGIRFQRNSDNTCQFYLLQYLFKCIVNKLIAQQQQLLNKESKGK